MTPDDDMEWSLLDRYLSGRCTPEESAAMRRWAARDPARARLLAAVQRIWDEAGDTPLRFDAEVAVRALKSARGSGLGVASQDPWREVACRISSGSVPRARRIALSPFERPGRWRRAPLAVAAALVLAVSGAAWHWRSRVSAPAGEDAGTARVYATAPGQRAEVLLTDGTHVWLNVDSRIRIPPDFGVASRRVELEGEAYFAVKHDDRRPFRVHAAHAMVEDLGTQFLVRAYASDSSTAVAVAEGKVTLGPGEGRSDRGVLLVRGQRGEIDGAGAVTVSDDEDIDSELSWREGRLVLRHVPLHRAVHELERWYGVDIALGDSSLASVIVTASFRSDSIDDALRILSGTLGVRYTRAGIYVRLLPGEAR